MRLIEAAPNLLALLREIVEDRDCMLTSTQMERALATIAKVDAK